MNTTTTQPSDEDGSAEDGRERRTVPSVVEIAELFGELEWMDLATECQVSDALSYLGSAKHVFLTANFAFAVSLGLCRVLQCKTRQRPRVEQADFNYRMHEIDVTTSPIKAVSQ